MGGLKIFFQIKYLFGIFLGLFCLGMFACAKTAIDTPPLSDKDHSIQTGIPGKNLEDLSPRAQASLRLTDQGRQFLEDGKAGDAIRMLERAINLDPGNGLNYYYLSEAWLYKGNFKQAEEFNRLAHMYLKNSHEWMVRVGEQGGRIDELRQ